MKYIKISQIFMYGAGYGEKVQYYFFSLNDMKIYSRDELIKNFAFEDDILSNFPSLYDIYSIIPLFRCNLIAEMRKFLENENNKKISREIRNMSDGELYYYFQIITEKNQMLGLRWDKYSDECLINAAVEWCKEYSLPYIM